MIDDILLLQNNPRKAVTIFGELHEKQRLKERTSRRKIEVQREDFAMSWEKGTPAYSDAAEE